MNQCHDCEKHAPLFHVLNGDSTTTVCFVCMHKRNGIETQVTNSPDARFGWQATKGGMDEGCRYGEGSTERAAIEDLLEQMAEDAVVDDDAGDWDPYEAAGESPFGLPGGDRSL